MTKKNSDKSENRKWWITPLVTIITAIVSVYGTLFYQHWMSQPRISGRIVVEAHGRLDDTRIVKVPMHTVTIWAYLSNSREVPVSVVDYQLDALVKNKWHRIKGLYNNFQNLRLNFNEPSPFSPYKAIVFPSDNNLLMHDMTLPITRNSPRGGLIIFTFPENELSGSVEKIRLIIYDGYGGKHIIESDPSQKHDPHVLLRLVPGIRFE